LSGLRPPDHGINSMSHERVLSAQSSQRTNFSTQLILQIMAALNSRLLTIAVVTATVVVVAAVAPKTIPTFPSRSVTLFTATLVATLLAWAKYARRAGPEQGRSPKTTAIPAEAQQANAPRAAVVRMAEEIQRAGVSSLEDAKQLAGTPQWSSLVEAAANEAKVEGRRLGLAIYPGSFNPPSLAHVEATRQIAAQSEVDAVWLDMTTHRDKKLHISQVTAHRRKMTEVAVGHLENVGVTQLMTQMGDRGWGREYFDTIRALFCDNPDARKLRLTWVMGSDVVKGMCWWPEKARELLRCCDEVVVLSRQQKEEDDDLKALEAVLGKTRTELNAEGFAISLLQFSDSRLEQVSSSAIRRSLVSLLQLVPLSILRYIVNDTDLVNFYISFCENGDVQAEKA